MFWLGLLRAFTSKAHTPIFQDLEALDSISLIELAAVLAAVLPLNLLGARLDERVECPKRAAERASGPASALADFIGLCCPWCLVAVKDSVGVTSFCSDSKGDTAEAKAVSGTPFEKLASAGEPLLWPLSGSMSWRRKELRLVVGGARWGGSRG